MKASELIDNHQNMHFSDMLKYYNVENAYNNLHDKIIPWINYNSEKCITTTIKNKKNTFCSIIRLFYDIDNYNENKSVDDFQKFLEEEIKVYRGGAGKYDPEYNRISRYRDWVSFTYSKKRMDTFSVYNGSYAKNVYKLDKNTSYWQVELTIPIKSILLYVFPGYDSELIISLDDAKKATLINDQQ